MTNTKRKPEWFFPGSIPGRAIGESQKKMGVKMMARLDLYDFVAQCKEDGLTSDEAFNEWAIACEESRRDFMEEYENDPAVCYGWYQQDMIDLRYRER